MGNNLDHRWTMMVKMAKEAKETLAQITTMVVAERIYKSGRVHAWRRITLDYRVEQSEVQGTYYTQYRWVLEYTTQDR
jgi:hypothetical protein